MKTAILIQSNDEYTHLWDGLFLSWKLNWNWNDFNYPVYVITESKKFKVSYKNNDFHTINVGIDLQGIENYSNKLLKALKFLKSEGFTHILYTQDDAWPLCSVDTLLLKDIITFIKIKNSKCFYLHECFYTFPFSLKQTGISLQNKKVKRFATNSRFYYNHGNAFWDLNFLINVQNQDESPYDNECNTTQRCAASGEVFYFINIPWYDGELINNKGKLTTEAKEILDQFKFRYKYENLEDFGGKLISFNGYLMDTDGDDPNFRNLSTEQQELLYQQDKGIFYTDSKDIHDDRIHV